jgi:D-xylose transport system permease protein
LVLVIGMAVFAMLVFSGISRRRSAGLDAPLMSGLVFPLIAGALFGTIVVWILNSHQGIPLVTLVFAVLLALGGFVLRETQFGLHLYAVGNNDEAARRAGIKVASVKMAAFAIAGGVAALAGVIAASRTLGVGVFSGGGIGGGTLLLESIAAAVIGGVSLFGGRGSIHDALLLVLAVSIDKLIERFTGQQAF